MEISVIIPVYNAERFVEQAVHSALEQREVSEVLLIEDGSPDQAIIRCRALSETHDRVRLIQHPGGANKGASASRNLGINSAENEYIAFLDADDFYLTDRFKSTCQIFKTDPSTEAVYEAVGTHFDSDEARVVWENMRGPSLTTVLAGTSEDLIFSEQSPVGKAGHCHLNGLTVKKSVFLRTGLFNPELILGEDTVFTMKLAACARIRLGEVVRPIAMRRVHDHNRVTVERSDDTQWNYRLLVWLSFLRWLGSSNMENKEAMRRIVIERLLWDLSAVGVFSTRLKRTLEAVAKHPELAMSKQFIIGAIKRILHRFL